MHITETSVAGDIVVGVVICYGLDSSGFELGVSENFFTPTYQLWDPPILLSNWHPEVKRPGRGVGHPPASSAKVKENIIMLNIMGPPLYTLSVADRKVMRRIPVYT
jgi:hypothetical protein